MAAALMMFAAAAGCNKEEGEINEDFTITSEDVQFDGNTLSFKGERKTLLLDVATEEAAGKWEAYSPTDDRWIYLYQQDGSLAVTVEGNNTDAPRSSWIEIALGSNSRRIVVEQDYIRILNFLTDDLVQERASQHVVTLPIETNILTENLSVAVTSPADCDWITNLAVNADASAVTFTILQNPDEDSRPATISLSGEGRTATLTVVQYASASYPYEIDMSEATFDDCYIYEIWDVVNQVKVGELCKEYLYKIDDQSSTTVVQQQTIVAYPMKDGKPDLSKGLTVDGHFVKWNPDVTTATLPFEMLEQYAAGESAIPAVPASVIYLDDGADRMTIQQIAAPAESRIKAKLEPMLVRDQRSGTANNQGQTSEDFSYRIVKIGTQYWMADNLRTSRYADTGEPIPTAIESADWTGNIAPGCCITYRTEGRASGVATESWVDANATSDLAKAARAQFGLSYNYHAITRTTATAAAEIPVAQRTDKISPAGWAVPTRDQFEILLKYVFQATSLPSSGFELSAYAGDRGLPLGNVSGFSAIGNSQRTGAGGFSSGTRYYMIDTYGYASNQHSTAAFEMLTNLDADNDKPQWVANGASSTTQRGYYVRCLRKE